MVNLFKLAKQAMRIALPLCLFALPSKADSTYSYTGNAFNVFVGDAKCPPECRITGSFTVSAPLPDNSELTVSPTSFSFTSFNGGLPTLTQLSVTSIPFFLVVTGPDGSIIGWNIGLESPSYSLFWGTAPPNCPPFMGTSCSVVDTSATDSTGAAYILGDPGTWSTPEPSSLIMLVTSMLGLIGFSMRRIIVQPSRQI
jgi:hypothetical protein